MRDSLLEDIHEESTEESLVETLTQQRQYFKEKAHNYYKLICIMLNEGTFKPELYNKIKKSLENL